jgi:uncharacterized protein (DUF4415 family)
MARSDIRRYSASELRRLRAKGATKTKRDAPVIELDDKFWRTARLVMPAKGGKSSVHLRVDSSVLEWVRKRGRGHLTRMNSVLRAYVEAHRKSSVR